MLVCRPQLMTVAGGNKQGSCFKNRKKMCPDQDCHGMEMEIGSSLGNELSIVEEVDRSRFVYP